MYDHITGTTTHSGLCVVVPLGQHCKVTMSVHCRQVGNQLPSNKLRCCYGVKPKQTSARYRQRGAWSEAGANGFDRARLGGQFLLKRWIIFFYVGTVLSVCVCVHVCMCARVCNGGRGVCFN